MNNNFLISIEDNIIDNNGDPSLRGIIQILDFQETLYLSLSYWKIEDYFHQWKEGIQRLIDGYGKSALITSMYNPEYANFIIWWLFYKVNSTIYIQNQILFLEELQPFSEENIYIYVPDRQTITEEGDKISEWSINSQDINLSSIMFTNKKS